MKKTATFVETQEVWIIRRRRPQPAPLCAECADPSEMLTPEAAASLSGLSLRAIYRLVEAGCVHFAETTKGWVLICPDSLFAAHRCGLTEVSSLPVNTTDKLKEFTP